MPDHSFDLPVQLTDFDIDIASMFLLALCNFNDSSGTVEFGDFANIYPLSLLLIQNVSGLMALTTLLILHLGVTWVYQWTCSHPHCLA
ncbi:hypothetical protein [Photobacterium sp. DNB22_13_2]